MYAQYTAIDGFDIDSNSVLAAIMTDTAADIDVDQSGNSNNLTENGTLTTAVVETGAGAIAASGFSSSNYLERAYDADFDPGTAGLSAQIWFKHPGISVAADYIFMRDSATTAQNYLLAMNATGTIYSQVDDNTTVRSVTTSASYDDDLWHLAIMVFDGTTLYLYIDGVLVGSSTGSALLTLSNVSAILRIGRRTDATNEPWGGSLAGFELDIGNQWTAQRVRTIYDNEKVLFEQYEPYSQVGATVGYEIGLSNSIPGVESKKAVNTSQSGKQTGFTWYQKNTFNCSSILVQGLAARGKMRKFLRSTELDSFTFDEVGTEAAADNPITVYRTGGGLTRQPPDFFQLNFSVREQ